MADLKRALFGYSSASVRSELSERDAVLDRASKNATAAEQRAESLSSELSETQGRLAGLEEQLDAARELSASLTADLDRSVGERESIEAEGLSLRREPEGVRSELRDAKEAVIGRDEQLRALDESGGFEATMSAQAKRVAELEELAEGYREMIEGGNAPTAPSAHPSNGQEPPAAPSTAGELAAVIEVAEQAVASIMQSTRARADEELRAVDGERERIKRDVATITAWRDRAEPVVASLQAAMREMQGQAAEVGLRVHEALRPVSTAVTQLATQLASLDDLAAAPVDVPSETPAPARPDRVTKLPEEHPASRDWDG